MPTALALDPYAPSMTPPRADDRSPVPEGDRDLVDRARRGDLAAFETLYRMHAGRVFALCQRLSGDRADATALLQDAFVRAWERLSTFRGESSLTTWLHRLTVNCFLEAARKTKRREARVELQEMDEWRAASTPDASGAVAARLDLEAALPRLAAGPRRVFVLHDIYGYRHEEIAALLGVAAATVRVQLFRARKQLMEILDR